jgi:hypothetical protein
MTRQVVKGLKDAELKMAADGQGHLLGRRSRRNAVKLRDHLKLAKCQVESGSGVV